MDLKTQELILLIEEILGTNGCPWGKTQEPEALCHYVIEESYEVIDAIREKDLSKIEEELGDVLFAALFTIKSASKKYGFDPDKITEGICKKIKRRHPHVFENPRPITFEQLRVQWEEIKAKERADQNKGSKEDLFDSIAKSMPPVTRAMKLIELGFSKGFEYDSNDQTLEGRFMQLMIDGLNKHENLEHIFDNGIRDYRQKFKDWLDKEKPEMVS
jgi:MazG family protein